MNWWIFGISVWLFCIALIWAFFLGACGGKAPEIKFKGGVKSMTKKKEQVPLGQELLAAILNNPKESQTPWYRRRLRQRSGISPITRSKYEEPHQGDREKQRRLRQIMAGHIQNKD